MNIRTITTLTAVIAAVACEPAAPVAPPKPSVAIEAPAPAPAIATVQPRMTTRANRIAAAAEFTGRYAASRLESWKVRASAAGADCRVLAVHTSLIMDDSMVEALHYGAGAYDVYDGGVERFYPRQSFRGVVYEDATRHTWTYGEVTAAEAAALCH